MKASARFNGVNLQDAKLPWKDLYRRGKIAQQKFEAFYRCAIASNRCAKIFLRERTIKRGGLYKFMSLDAEAAESRYQHEPAADLALTPEQIFDARWALTLLNEAMKTVQVQPACCEMSRRDSTIVAWHEVPGTAPRKRVELRE